MTPQKIEVMKIKLQEDVEAPYKQVLLIFLFETGLFICCIKQMFEVV